MKYSALLLILLISFSSSKTIEEKFLCLLKNENVLKSVINAIKSIIDKEQTMIILSKIYMAYTEIKKGVDICWKDEPALKRGCRYEEQFQNCQKNSCDYMEEYECFEYCARKYC